MCVCLSVPLKRVVACGWRCPSGLAAMAGHAFEEQEPGHLKELLPAVGPRPALGMWCDHGLNIHYAQ